MMQFLILDRYMGIYPERIGKWIIQTEEWRLFNSFVDYKYLNSQKCQKFSSDMNAYWYSRLGAQFGQQFVNGNHLCISDPN